MKWVNKVLIGLLVMMVAFLSVFLWYSQHDQWTVEFLHCSTGNATAGCVSVSEWVMVDLLQFIDQETKIVIADSVDNLLKY